MAREAAQPRLSAAPRRPGARLEFVAAGTFETWRRKLGSDLTARVLICTDSAAGHHLLSREDTFRTRRAEQEASAGVGNYEFELLRLPDGQPPREAGLQVSVPLLAALWAWTQSDEVAAFATALLSGVFGMAGGLALTAATCLGMAFGPAFRFGPDGAALSDQ